MSVTSNSGIEDIVREISKINIDSYDLLESQSPTKWTTQRQSKFLSPLMETNFGLNFRSKDKEEFGTNNTNCISDPVVLFDLSGVEESFDMVHDGDLQVLDEFDLNRTFTSKTLGQNELSFMLAALEESEVEEEGNKKTNEVKNTPQVRVSANRSITCL